MSRSPTHIDLNRMAVFALVVESGSMSAAARRMGVGRASVSRDVAQLEADCGVRLLQRTTQSIGLTPVGEAFFETCQRILGEARAGADLIRGESAEGPGVVRIAATADFGRLVLIPILARLTEATPTLDIDLRLGDERSDLITEGIDIAFRVGFMRSSSHRAKRLGQARYVLVASPAYAERVDVRHPSDLLPRDHARFIVPGGTFDFRLQRAEEHHDWEAAGPLLVNDSVALVAYIKEAAGYAAILDFISAPELAAGQLVELLPEWSLPYSIPIWAVWPHSRLGARARRVMNAVQEHLQAVTAQSSSKTQSSRPDL